MQNGRGQCGLNPGGRHGVATSGMEESDVVGLGGSVVGTVGLVFVAGHKESMIPRAGILKMFINHAEVRCGGLGIVEWEGPEPCVWVSGAG